MRMYASYLPNRRFRLWDVVVLIAVFGLFYGIVALGSSMNVAFQVENQVEISLDPWILPYYAGRSLLRMFAAFFASLVFTLVYGYIAAKNKTAGKFMVPLLDVLQSVPVLGFLSVTITTFMGLFPGNLLGVELASMFAIFTGQAWNMTFSFYHSLITVPEDLYEASHVLKLNWWQRFTRLEVPFSMIGLVWNSMMSFGGGWFFLAASEAITVLGHTIKLPGIGSYMALAVEEGNYQAIVYSIVVMILMVVIVDVIFWRPIVVWSQKFKMEMTEASEEPTSFVFDILNRSVIIDVAIKYVFGPMAWKVDEFFSYLVTLVKPIKHRRSSMLVTALFRTVKGILLFVMVLQVARYITAGYDMISRMDSSYVVYVFLCGFYTMGRVMVALFLGALWTIPVGVFIGMNPRMAKIMQPVVQIMASFPANMVFPFVTVLYIKLHVNFEWGAIPLMMLGTQWYILFNVIAGAMSIPNDLVEAGAVFKLRGWQKWKRLILPGIFPYLITGAVTASGGAWNASIVSELVGWENQELAATGLGAFISKVTQTGDWPGIILGISVMCIFVVTINRWVWHSLYVLAETRYHVE